MEVILLQFVVLEISEDADLNQAREQISAVSGTITAGLVFGGQGPPPAMQTVTERWNGTSYAETGDLNTGRYLLAGSGTTTAGLAFGGDLDPGFSAKNEFFNGTSWTEVNDLNTARATLSGFGTSTSALACGGGGPDKANTETWNGGAWTETSDLNTAGRRGNQNAHSGTTSNGLIFGGNNPPPVSNVTEEWAGTSSLTKVLTD